MVSFIVKILAEVMGNFPNLDEVEEADEGRAEAYEKDEVNCHGYYLECCHC